MLYDLFRQSKKIVIDASHGGEDSGLTYNGKLEKDLTLEISEYMYNRLIELGIPVSITRESDYTLSDDERINKIKNFYGDSSDVIVISNRVDSDNDDVQIIYALRNDNDLSDLISTNLRLLDLSVKEPYQRRSISDTSKDYYLIHRNTGLIEPIIIQYGNITNYDIIENNYKQYVDAVIDGLVEYLGVPFSGEFYIVKSGDTLYSIARKYNMSLDELKKLNNLNSNYISVGQKLSVKNNSDDNDNIDLSDNYIVKKGDTLYSIARLYNMSVSDLKKYNNLKTDVLSIGQVIKIPNVSSEYIEYIVKSGDNLYQISKRYNISVSDIMKYNNLKSNLLSIGQVIKIPNVSSEYIEYIVKNGDTLYSIARKYNTTVDSIKNKNNLTSNLLNVGQKLVI